VLLNKHFFHYKYDYRDEWLRFIRMLSSGAPEDGHMGERVIHSLAEIIESPGGILWLRDGGGRYIPEASWQMEADDDCVVRSDHALIQFMSSSGWLIDLDEYNCDPDIYNRFVMPHWIDSLPEAWLIVPLIVYDRLIGFVVLARSPAKNHFNWEDSDLLKTAGRQAAVHIAQMQSSHALAEAREFEVCNRLSTYVMHDLKNLIAQLSLVVSNATKHKHNPEFMEDVIHTVDNSVSRMNRLLAQLRSDASQSQPVEIIELCSALSDVVSGMSAGKPVPSLDCQVRDVMLLANPERFSAVIGHIIRNAQDATPDDGHVIVRLFGLGSHAIIEVQDTGSGMDQEFIDKRLFRPFDSTKGQAGMGIGVYETRDFVNKIGGDIEVISRVGEGTTFRIRLPISENSENTVTFPKSAFNNDTDGLSYKKITGH
jgi:putative PEP-CTERM system histidine kinase